MAGPDAAMFAFGVGLPLVFVVLTLVYYVVCQIAYKINDRFPSVSVSLAIALVIIVTVVVIGLVITGVVMNSG
jgi:hypothetical protein